MTLSPTSRVFSKTSPSRLGTYLATAVGSCGLATSADADIVAIDITNINGNNISATNGGVANGGVLNISNWLGEGTGQLRVVNNFVYNGYFGSYGPYFGIVGVAGLGFARNGGNTSPTNFSYGATIGATSTFISSSTQTVFKFGSSESQDFGTGSYMGFRFGSTGVNYGWLEVTWDSATTTFQVLSGAYESTVDTPILAGATAPVPEPSTGALAALVLGGTAVGVARRRRKKIAPATTEQAV